MGFPPLPCSVCLPVPQSRAAPWREETCGLLSHGLQPWPLTCSCLQSDQESPPWMTSERSVREKGDMEMT